MQSILLRIRTGLDSASAGAAAITFWPFRVFFFFLYLCCGATSLFSLANVDIRLFSFPRCGEPSASCEPQGSAG